MSLVDYISEYFLIGGKTAGDDIKQWLNDHVIGRLEIERENGKVRFHFSFPLPFVFLTQRENGHLTGRSRIVPFSRNYIVTDEVISQLESFGKYGEWMAELRVYKVIFRIDDSPEGIEEMLRKIFPPPTGTVPFERFVTTINLLSVTVENEDSYAYDHFSLYLTSFGGSELPVRYTYLPFP
ncbi:MAG: hypothetical protein QW815_06695 [Nitrososphaerota archaeon]